MRLLLFLLGTCALWIMCASLRPDFSAPFRYIWRRNEKIIESDAILGGPKDGTSWFFSPKTCRPKDGRKVEACQGKQDLNSTMCLYLDCCYTTEESFNAACYTPLVDNVQLTLHFFIIGIMCLLFLGCIPLCICILCQKTKLNH